MRSLAACLLVTACSADPQFLATTTLGSTHDTAGPYHVDTVVTGVAWDDEVRLMVAIDTSAEERFFAREMTRYGGGDGDRWSGAIPGQPARTDVFYFVEVQRGFEQVAKDPDDGLAFAFGFEVLPPDGACSVDSECVAGAEVCDGGVCATLPGACETTAECPTGYECEVQSGTCALPPRPCESDDDCPTSDECNAAGTCAPRHTCGDSVACPDGYACNPALGRCYLM